MSDPRVRAQAHFAPIPEWVLFAPELSPQAVRVYGVLLRLAERGSRRGRVRHRTIAARSGGVSVPTIKRAIAELQAFGAVEVTRKIDRLGQHANEYLVRAVPLEPQTSLLEIPPETPSEPGSSPVTWGQVTGERGVTDDLGAQVTGDLPRRSSERLEPSDKTSPTASPTAKSPICGKPTPDCLYLAERINERWGASKGRLTPAALQRLVSTFGVQVLEDALRELHGFPPEEAIRSPYAYLQAILAEGSGGCIVRSPADEREGPDPAGEPAADAQLGVEEEAGASPAEASA